MFKNQYDHPFTKIYFTFGLILLIIASGVVGFMVIEHYTFIEALYMTVITISTVGYQEVHPLSTAGKIFDILLIITNIGLFTYFISTLTKYFMDGEFRQLLKIRNMKQSISTLKGHTILCGFGRNGQAAAEVLRQSQAPFVVIERKFTHRDNIEHHLEGDATDENLLLEAGIENAAALITTLSDDAENLYIVLSSRQLNSKLRIISRASNDQAVKKMKIAGADNVIMPDKIGGTHMATLVLSPDVKEFIDILATQNFDGITIQELTMGKSLILHDLDCWKQTGTRILGIKTMENQYIMNPAHSQQVDKGYRLIVMGNKEQIAKLSSLIQ